MARVSGTYTLSTTSGEAVRAFVPNTLPPLNPALAETSFIDLNRQAELALARLAGVSGLVPSVDWLLYSAIRKEALLTSQIEGTQATLTDLFDEEAGFAVSNTDDVEEVTNYLSAFKLVQEQLRDPNGLPLSVRLLCDAHRLLLNGVRGTGKHFLAHARLALQQQGDGLVQYAPCALDLAVHGGVPGVFPRELVGDFAEVGEAGGEDGLLFGFQRTAKHAFGEVGERFGVVVAAAGDGFLREVAGGFDELRVVHGDEGLQRCVGAVTADAADFAAGGIEDVHVR